MNKTLSYLTILIVGVFALRLVIGGELSYYINPGYIPFATLASSLCVVVGIGGLMWRYQGSIIGPDHLSERRIQSLAQKALISAKESLLDRKLWLVVGALLLSLITLPGIILLLIVLMKRDPSSRVDSFLRQNHFYYLLVVVALISAGVISPKPLGSEAAGQLTGSLNNLVASGEEPSTLNLFAFDSSKFGIGDWIKRINFDPDLAAYVGKQVRVIGFVHHPAEFDAESFLVSRFVISCCAVDARPVGLPVHSPGWRALYPVDSWVQVTGEFVISEIAGKEALVIVPNQVEIVSQPATPYIY